LGKNAITEAVVVHSGDQHWHPIWNKYIHTVSNVTTLMHIQRSYMSK